MRFRTASGTVQMEILRAARQPIRIVLPVSVASVVAQEIEWGKRIQDPAGELARLYREWEDGTSGWVEMCGRDLTTCYDDCCGDPSLLFWTLEHFSDPDFPIAGERKFDLTFHTFAYAELLRSHYVTELMSTETADSLEYCWYFLVRLLAIQEELAARTGEPPDDPAADVARHGGPPRGGHKRSSKRGAGKRSLGARGTCGSGPRPASGASSQQVADQALGRKGSHPLRQHRALMRIHWSAPLGRSAD